MTPYTPSDLAEGWEFKILRSATGGFGNPARLQSVLDEEQRAGWTLVEKFDNGRIRLKRPARARTGDAALDFDLAQYRDDTIKKLDAGAVAPDVAALPLLNLQKLSGQGPRSCPHRLQLIGSQVEMPAQEGNLRRPLASHTQ